MTNPILSHSDINVLTDLWLGLLDKTNYYPRENRDDIVRLIVDWNETLKSHHMHPYLNVEKVFYGWFIEMLPTQWFSEGTVGYLSKSIEIVVTMLVFEETHGKYVNDTP